MSKPNLIPIPCSLRKGDKCCNLGGCVFQTKDGKCAPAIKSSTKKK